MKNLTKTLLAASVLAASALAHAGPVNTWNATTTATWSDATSDGGNGNPPVINGNILSWGTPSPPGIAQSSLTITNPAANLNLDTYIGGGAVPDGYITQSISLTHQNNPITGTFLTGATLNVGLTLKPTDPLDDLIDLGSFGYKIRFLETPNQAPCAVDSLVPCRDIFVQVGGLLNQSFYYDNFTYFVNAFPLTADRQLNMLSDAACAAVMGAGSTGCLGFTTEEFAATRLDFGLVISTESLQVPEPGSLALMGLALAGLGFVNRRRRSAA